MKPDNFRKAFHSKRMEEYAWQRVTILDEDFDSLPNQYPPTAENLHTPQTAPNN